MKKPEKKTLKSNLLAWKRTQNAQQKEQSSPERLVILENGESMFFKQSTRSLLNSHNIYSKMIGINSSSKNITDFVCEPYLIDKYSTAFVVKNKILDLKAEISNAKGVQLIQDLLSNVVYLAYACLMEERKMFLVDGHKFGCHFLAYDTQPDLVHAKYLVFVRQSQKELLASHVSRLTGICKKKALIITLTLSPTDAPKIQCQQIQPRVSESRKAQRSSATEQLNTLKRMIGYDV